MVCGETIGGLKTGLKKLEEVVSTTCCNTMEVFSNHETHYTIS